MPLGVSDSSLSDGVNNIIHILTLIFIFIIVIVIAMVATRIIAGYQKGASNAANIEVIETCRLTVNKYIQIVRVGEKYLAIAIGKDEVSFLTEISPDEIQLAPSKAEAMPDFASLLAKFTKRNKDTD